MRNHRDFVSVFYVVPQNQKMIRTEGLQAMKKKLSIIILSIGALIFAWLYAHIDKNIYLYDRNTDAAELVGTGILLSGEEITQSFTSVEDAMDGINLKATVIGDTEDINIEYSLIDEDSGEAVRTETVQGTEIKNNKFNILRFQTLKDTKGKNYILRLTESGTGDNAGISFYLSEREGQGGMLKVKGQETKGILAVRTLTHRFDLETFFVLLGILAFIAGFMNVLYRMFQ